MYRPLDRCPKCNDANGFLHAKPRYHTAIPYTGGDKIEWLEWECSSWGYTLKTDTADHVQTETL